MLRFAFTLNHFNPTPTLTHRHNHQTQHGYLQYYYAVSRDSWVPPKHSSNQFKYRSLIMFHPSMVVEKDN